MVILSAVARLYGRIDCLRQIGDLAALLDRKTVAHPSVRAAAKQAVCFVCGM